MYRRFIFFIAAFSAVLIFSCSESGTSAQMSIKFEQDIQPALNTRCVSCHGSQQSAAGLRLDSWENIIKGSDFGEVVIPFDADNSLLYELLTKRALPGQHYSGDTLTISELQDIRSWIEEGGRNRSGRVPYEDSANRLYVCNQNSSLVSIIDTDSRVVIRTIKLADLGFSTNAKPHDVKTTASGSWFVSLIADGKILKFNSGNKLSGQADFEAAGLLAVSSDGERLYAGHTLSIPSVPQTLAALNIQDMSLEAISLPYTRPHALAAGKGNNIIYNISLVDNRLSTINTAQNATELSSVQLLGSKFRTIVQLDIAADNQRAVISSQFENKLLILDLSDLNNIPITDSVNVGQQPWHPKFSADGSKIYVGNLLSNTVSVVNAQTYQLEATIGSGDGSDGLAQPHGLVVSADGHYIYVSCRNAISPPLYTARYELTDNSNSGTMVIINTLTHQIEKVLELEGFPSGLALSEAE